MSKARGPYRVDPLGYKKKADEALDRMAENARELELDYEPAQQEAKIVRWNCPCGNKYTFHGFTEAPAQRKPLTDEQIDRLWSQSLADTESETWLPLREFARAIEAAHGIKGDT